MKAGASIPQHRLPSNILKLLSELSQPSFCFSHIPPDRMVVDLPLLNSSRSAYTKQFPLAPDDKAEVKAQLTTLLM